MLQIVRFLAIVRHHKKIIEIVESEARPTISKIWRRPDQEYELKVFVVLIARLVRFS